jgi:hypothetical protein
MTTLPETALAFARECMGWKAELSHGSVTRNNEGVLEHLRFTDLSAVMAAVRAWCDKHGIGFQMNYGDLRVSALIWNFKLSGTPSIATAALSRPPGVPIVVRR